MRKSVGVVLSAGAALAWASPAFAGDAGAEAEIAELKVEIAAQDKQLSEQAALLKAQAARLEAIENQLQSSAAPASPPPTAGVPAGAIATSPDSPSPAQVAANDEAAPASDTTIGGYGEITYNGYLKDKSRNQADLKRFVLFFGHRFDDKLSFNSEFEVEHAIASADDAGEAEIEQAYLNYRFGQGVNLKAGLFLMPFGFLNRNHEPPVFYGVERNEVETRIIPSTWREGGVGIYGSTAFGLDYDFGVTTGFDVAKLDDAGAPLAGSHQELQLAKAANLSFYGSLEYRGVPGLLLGTAVFTGDATHDNADFKADATLPDFAGITSRVTLWDVHGRWQHNGLDLEALYARGTIGRARALDSVLLGYNAANGADLPVVPSAFYGWLVQAAYSIPVGGEMTLDPFVRYEKFDTQARLPLGLVADLANRDRVLTTGFSFRPLDQVVVKVDYQKFFENSDNDRVNVGLGYMF
jgi:hypothetical protein